ncbi:tetratricopeptide repeat protein [Shewanella electrodiphila]|uniref:Tetratricopeptide repeat protein n=1 Tax=Shewanella electrodiphila TaxID=934143 RepID=A0ABT0KJC4_9GAMM|nr:tetratricopeptide repeat protein [Shewanella electrodiphila]MCL1043824.1 tetratricopeptide repeat protein [Shewanella electrodiphila]
MAKHQLNDAVKIPDTAFEITQHLGFSQEKKALWAWYEIAGSVMSLHVEDPQQRFEGLLRWFYTDLGFCAREDYFSVEAADLGSCIMSRQGNSTTLATVMILLAKQLDITLDAVLLPGQTVVRSRINDNIVYIDPLTGLELSRHQLHLLVRGELGNSAMLKPKYLKTASLKRLITRMLHELKAGCIVTHQFEQAMECCNLLLQWHPDDVNLNRERAFIAQQLGCIKVAISDLQHFIDSSPHDPVTEIVKMQLKELSDQPQTYH